LQTDLSRAERAVRKAEEAGEEPTLEQSEVAASILVTIFAGWNLTDDKAKTCPCTVRFLVDELGYFAIGALLREVYDRLDPQRGNGSSRSLSSPPATLPESRRNAKSSSAL